MQRQHVAQGVAIALVFVISIALAAEGRFTLQSPNGIAFSESNGYEAWQTIAPNQTNDAGRWAHRPLPVASRRFSATL
jgi:hypothetical protein